MFREGLLKKLQYEDRIILIPIDKASEMKNELIGQFLLISPHDQTIAPELVNFYEELVTLFMTEKQAKK
mgnify:CR=1 FL=1